MVKTTSLAAPAELEGGLGVRVILLLSQRTQVWFPAPASSSSQVPVDSGSSGLNTLFGLHMHITYPLFITCIPSNKKSNEEKAGRMVWWVRMHVPKPADLSLIPRAYVGKGESQLLAAL